MSMFTLANAILESSYDMITHNEAYEFIGDDINEAVREMNSAIMSEAVDLNNFYMESSNIIMEAAITGNDRIDIIVEASAEGFKEKAMGLLKKIREMLQGLANKVKQQFFKIIGKTDAWLKVAQPRIEAAAKKSDAANFTHSMHKWDLDYINDMPEKFAKAINSTNVLDDMKSSLDKLKAGFDKTLTDGNAEDENDRKNNQQSFRNRNTGYDKNHNLNGNMTYDNSTKRFQERVIEEFDIKPSSNDYSAIYAAIDEKVTGGKKEDYKIVSEFGIDAMIKFIKGAKAASNEIIKPLNDTIKQVKDGESYLKGIDFKAAGDDKSFNKEVTTAYNQRISACMQKYKDISSFCSTMSGKITAYHNKATSEFVSALNKFSGLKSKDSESEEV